MKIVFITLMLCAGVSVSFVLIRDLSQKERDAGRMYELSSFIEERIRIARSPLARILEEFNLSNKPSSVSISDLTECPDPEIARHAHAICSLDYSTARCEALLLKNYTERKLQRIREDNARRRKVNTVLPVAASLLISLLLI